MQKRAKLVVAQGLYGMTSYPVIGIPIKQTTISWLIVINIIIVILLSADRLDKGILKKYHT